MYENEVYSDDDNEIHTQYNSRNKVTKIMSDTDPAFFKIRRHGNDDKKLTIGFFASGCQGCSIRNAVTGIRDPNSIVGSRAEDMYFKVAFCTGETGPDTNILFYDTPEQYERHMHATVSESSKKAWFNKMIAAQNRLVK